jgi:ABC-type phosphate transport system substrate-binding protein
MTLMTKILSLLMMCVLVVLPVRAQTAIVVVVHPASPVISLTKKQVSELYLGRNQYLGGNQRLQLLDQPRDSKLREQFFAQLMGMDLGRINAYWARLQFSGDIQPPLALPDSATVLKIVSHNPFAIGYMEASALTPAVRAVLTIKD